MMTKSEILLSELVSALNSTYWTSWQSTADFDDELKAAEEYLNELSMKDE